MPIKCATPGCVKQGKYVKRDGSSEGRLCCQCGPSGHLYYNLSDCCRFAGCQRRYSRGKYCADHALMSETNVSNKKCNFADPETGRRCGISANFGPVDGVAATCEAHQTAGMVNVNALRQLIVKKKRKQRD